MEQKEITAKDFAEVNILHRIAMLSLIAFTDAAKAVNKLHPNDNMLVKIIKCPDITAYGATMAMSTTVLFLLGGIFDPILPKETSKKQNKYG